MKCLSLWQPWATLIAIGAKQIETRHWSTNYRGPLLIHAAKHWDRGLSQMCAEEPFNTALCEAGFSFHDHGHTWGLPFGSIICLVSLDDCITTEDAQHPPEEWPFLSEYEADFGDFSEGRFAWLCKNVRRFPPPISFSGHQGIFNVPDAIVAEQLAKVVPVSPLAVPLAHTPGCTEKGASDE